MPPTTTMPVYDPNKLPTCDATTGYITPYEAVSQACPAVSDLNPICGKATATAYLISGTSVEVQRPYLHTYSMCMPYFDSLGRPMCQCASDYVYYTTDDATGNVVYIHDKVEKCKGSYTIKPSCGKPFAVVKELTDFVGKMYTYVPSSDGESYSVKKTQLPGVTTPYELPYSSYSKWSTALPIANFGYIDRSLSEPFVMYGKSHNAIRIFSTGYIAFDGNEAGYPYTNYEGDFYKLYNHFRPRYGKDGFAALFSVLLQTTTSNTYFGITEKANGGKVAVITFENMKIWSAEAPADDVDPAQENTFQMILHLGTGNGGGTVQVAYQSLSPVAKDNAVVGIRHAPVGSPACQATDADCQALEAAWNAQENQGTLLQYPYKNAGTLAQTSSIHPVKYFKDPLASPSTNAMSLPDNGKKEKGSSCGDSEECIDHLICSPFSEKCEDPGVPDEEEKEMTAVRRL